MQKIILAFTVFICTAIVGYGKVYKTQGSGNYTAASTWENNKKPGTWFGVTDTLIVSHKVTLNQHVRFDGVIIINQGAEISGSRNLEMNNNAKLINNGILNPNNITLNGNSKFVNHGSIQNNGSITLNGTSDLFNFGQLISNGFLKNNGDTVFLQNSAFFNGNIENNGGSIIILDSLISQSGGVTNNSGGVIYSDSASVLAMNNNLVNNANGSIFTNGKLNVGDNVVNNSNHANAIQINHSAIVGNNFVNNNGNILITEKAQLNVNNNLTNNGFITLNGSAFINNNFVSNSGMFTTSNNSYLEVNNQFTNYADFNLNGGLAIKNGGVNTANFIGTGLFQIDNGLTNWGSIGGSVDVCSSDGVTNPIVQGNGVSQNATLCFNSGANFPLTPAAPLPVELVGFDAEIADDNFVDLFWITASEINNDYFIVEKSDRNSDFNPVIKVKGAGTTNVKQIYEATDDQPCNDICFYRLKQVDFDGKTTTFQSVKVEAMASDDFNVQDIEVFPNPLVGNKVNVKLPAFADEEISFFINDLYGKPFVSDITFINLGTHNMVILEFNEKLPKGVYLINLIVNSEIISKKLYVN